MNKAEARVILGPLAGTWSVLPRARQAELLASLSVSQALALQVLFGAGEYRSNANAVSQAESQAVSQTVSSTEAAEQTGAAQADGAACSECTPGFAELIDLDGRWAQHRPSQLPAAPGMVAESASLSQRPRAVSQPANKPHCSAVRPSRPVRTRSIRRLRNRAREGSCGKSCFVVAAVLILIPPLLGLCAYMQ